MVELSLYQPPLIFHSDSQALLYFFFVPDYPQYLCIVLVLIHVMITHLRDAHDRSRIERLLYHDHDHDSLHWQVSTLALPKPRPSPT
jgi:hypothetical protein